MLYVPASNSRALAKIDSLAGRARPDAVMFDLEDGVSPDRKGGARDALFRHLSVSGGGGVGGGASASVGRYRRLNLLRINRADTPWFEDDSSIAHELAAAGSIDGVVIPKVEGGGDVDLASRRFLGLSVSDGRPPPPPPPPSSSSSSFDATTTRSPVALWAMVETPRAVLAAPEIAGMASVAGLILGTNDLGKELRLRRRRRRGPAPPSPAAIAVDDDVHRGGLSASLQWTILAARAHGKAVIDGVYNDIRDEAGFRNECARGREWGMDGKTLIHPDQVPWTNEIYAPDDEEVEHARRVVRCWDEAVSAAATTMSSGGRAFTGVAVLDGAMIEELHVNVARQLLRQVEIIKLME